MNLNQTLESARLILSRHGAHHLEEALRDNPDGPVQSITTRGACDIEYGVAVGDVGVDHGQARLIWSRTVTLGQTDRTSSGGADFMAAARAQEEVAAAAHAVLSASEEYTPDVVRIVASAPLRELPLHVIDQEDQPYGSTRRCCNRCGVMVHPGMKFVTSMAEWIASKETRCGAKTP